jgi:hypothetical protein
MEPPMNKRLATAAAGIAFVLPGVVAIALMNFAASAVSEVWMLIPFVYAIASIPLAIFTLSYLASRNGGRRTPYALAELRVVLPASAASRWLGLVARPPVRRIPLLLLLRLAMRWAVQASIRVRRSQDGSRSHREFAKRRALARTLAADPQDGPARYTLIVLFIGAYMWRWRDATAHNPRAAALHMADPLLDNVLICDAVVCEINQLPEGEADEAGAGEE